MVLHTTCTYQTTLEATAIPTPTVASPTHLLLGTLILPVDFMQEVTVFPRMALRCFTRQQLSMFRPRDLALLLCKIHTLREEERAASFRFSTLLKLNGELNKGSTQNKGGGGWEGKKTLL